MKANELMIGDWVRSKLHNVNSKVTDIEWQGDFGSVWLEEKKCWQRHFEDEIEPILLTEEILKKNGIGYQYGTLWYQNGFGRKCFEVHFSTHCRMDLRYVHELQHVLRLLRFDKEIVIK